MSIHGPSRQAARCRGAAKRRHRALPHFRPEAVAASSQQRASRRAAPSACRRTARGMRIGLFGGTFDPPHDGASRRLPAGDEAARARPGLVAGDARQSAQGHARPRAARASASPPRARSRTIRASTSPASRRNRHPLHLRDHRLSARALPGRALRLDHGRRQSAQLPSLAELARHRRNWCRSRWSTGSARASTPPPAPPARRSRASAFPKTRGQSCRDRTPPAWVFLHGLKSPLSSTALRARAGNRRKPRTERLRRHIRWQLR